MITLTRFGFWNLDQLEIEPFGVFSRWFLLALYLLIRWRVLLHCDYSVFDNALNAAVGALSAFS